MGCASSKIQHEDAVWQCGQRKSFVKQAVVTRTALASAHSRYLQSLTSTALALRQFSDGENPQISSSSASSVSSTAPQAAPASIDEEIVDVLVENTSSAMRLWNTPTEPITVVLSPPRRSPPEDYYIHFGGIGGGGGSPPPPLPPPVSQWEYFDIFHPAAAERRFKEMDGEEDIPTLELTDEEVIRASVRKAKGVVIEEVKEEDEVIRARKAKGEVKEEDEVIGASVRKAKGVVIEEVKEEDEVIRVSVRKSKGVLIEEVKEEEEEDRSDGAASSSSSGASSSAGSSSADAAAATAAGVSGSSNADGAVAEEVKDGENGGVAAAAVAAMELAEVLRRVEDQFMNAAEAGKAVSTTLEARKIHKQLERGFSDHSSRLLSALSLGHWSPRDLSPRAGIDSEESGGTTGSHAATLDRLYAWEKKLFEEVKAWENINSELSRKRKLLRNLDAKGAKADVIDKTRANMKALETEISVAVHAMEASSAEIQRISDDEVLPQLLELLKDLSEMWETMHKCHLEQLSVVMKLKVAGSSETAGTSPARNATVQLESALTAWQTSLTGFIQAQKDYVRNLRSWIKSSIHSDQGGNSRRNKKPVPKIQHLCEKWFAAVEKLSAADLTSKIKELSDTLRHIAGRQAEEMRILRRAESLSKELNRKIVSLNSGEKKVLEPREKQMAIESLQRKVGEEQQKLNRAARETRDYTSKGLQISLPPLFQALETFSAGCSAVHKELFVEVEAYNVVSVS